MFVFSYVFLFPYFICCFIFPLGDVGVFVSVRRKELALLVKAKANLGPEALIGLAWQEFQISDGRKALQKCSFLAKAADFSSSVQGSRCGYSLLSDNLYLTWLITQSLLLAK